MHSEITATYLSSHAGQAISENSGPPLKIVTLGNRSINIISKFIISSLQISGLQAELYELNAHEINLEILNNDSELYKVNPDIIILFQSYRATELRFFELPVETRNDFHSIFISEFEALTGQILSRLPEVQIIADNFEEAPDGVFGNYSNATKQSFVNQIRRINTSFMDFAEKQKKILVYDKCSLLAYYGLSSSLDQSMLYNIDLPYKLDIEAKMAWGIAGIISAQKGKLKKCLVLDLDNILWGGIIGDDGLEGIELGRTGIGNAFLDLQYWALELKRRGILLAICSKNTKEIALEVFEKHPEMILTPEDISVFAINWNNKAENILIIKETLHINLESMVFVDDSPFERNLVRNMLPEVTVPELPDDPAQYLTYLSRLNLFETTNVPSVTFNRQQFFSEETERITHKSNFSNLDDYLRSQNLKCKIEPVNESNKSRVSELSLRSNQFNLRTKRYSELEAGQLIGNDNYATYCLELKDKFGSYGLISVVVLKKINAEILFIENWFMSCRAMQRGVEMKLLNYLANENRNRGFKFIRGEYIPTSKNKIVAQHYQNMGFRKSTDTIWELNLDKYRLFETSIGDY